ncbi:hypothetical protein HJFPF1_11093 [Paramyrothecium foliicola]|nr:hypothetical protein HJFPF1_11093 [Paramyrothecium foliicola]
MPSHITFIPASTRAGRETLRQLLKAKEKPFVRAIYRDPTKAPAEFLQSSNLEAVRDDVGTDTALDFGQADAIIYVPPVNYDGSGHEDFAVDALRKVENALKTSNVKRLVLHSALGAHHSHGIGVLRVNQIADTHLKETVPEVIIVKPGWYHEMWASALKEMQGDESKFETTFSPADYKIPQVRQLGIHMEAKNINELKSSPHYVDIAGPREYSSLDVKEAIEQIIEKKGSVVELTEEQLPEFAAKEVPEQYVSEFVEMFISIRAGGLLANSWGWGEHLVRGKTEMVDALRQFA